MKTLSSARLRLVVCGAVASGLAVASVPIAHAAGPSTHTEGSAFKTRSVNALLDAASKKRATRARAEATAPKPSPKALKVADTTLQRRSGTPRLSAAPDLATRTTAADCTALNLDVTPTNDHVWVHWDSVGLDSYTILRRRAGGAWKQLGVAQASETSFLDKAVNPDAYFTYRLDADGISCELTYAVTMATDDGWGYVDAVYGGASANGADSSQLMAQDEYSAAMPVGLDGADPAFSPDGRRLASTAQEADLVWAIHVTDPAKPSRGNLVSVAMPAGYIGVEAAWSPDGRSIAYTRYAIDDQGKVSAPELHVVNATTGSDRTVSGSAGLMQADWRSSTTFVAAGFAVGEGLFTLPVAGGTKATVTGTANSGYPAVAPDGRVWFVEGDGTTFAFKVLTTSGQVVQVDSSTTTWWEQPRVAPNGDVYVVQVDGNDPTDPTDNTFSVVQNNYASSDPFQTAIGAPRDETMTGFHGYDVRQPKSKGTSDLVGNAGGDILARDSGGTLWAYPSTEDRFAGARVAVGTGWNIYNAFLAAGDLNGDNRGDILARDKDGRLWRYDGRGSGKVSGRVQIGSGWNGYLPLAPGDFNGDGKADLIARATNGELWLYPGTGSGTLTARTRLGTGWQSMNSIVGVGDFDLDNDADLLAREASTSRLWLYPGDGKGGFTPRRQVGAGWNAFNAIAGPELLGSNPFVYARKPDGQLLAYMVVGDGRFDGNEVYQVGTGWSPYSFTS